MAVKTRDQWKSSSYWDSAAKFTTYTASGVSAGAAVGGGMGAGIGAAIGATVGTILGFVQGNESEIDSFILDMKATRAQTTRARNQNILDVQKSISDTKSYFDSTYGSGMFDQYDSIFMEILGMPGSDSLTTLLANMQLDNVSGVIKSRLSGTATTDMLTSSLSVTDINSEYLSYLQEQLRAQDTTFGLQMQSYAAEDRQIWNSYYSSVSQASLQYAQQFSSAFLNARAENVSAETAMGSASLKQASSGIRQQGSGTALTTMQQFQNDLSKVAQASTVKYLLKSYGVSLGNANDNVIYQSYQTRQSIKTSTSQQLSNLISQYNSQNATNSKYYSTITDEEAAIDEANQSIGEANAGRTGIQHWFGIGAKYDDEHETLTSIT